MENSSFYDTISTDYDSMINHEKLIKSRKSQLQTFITNYSGNALDAGCGSGVDSIALSKLGFNVTGIDQSSKMIELAKKNAELNSSKIEFKITGLEELSHLDGIKYDLIISFGNTLSNLPPEKLSSFFLKSSELLNSKGTLILQVVNYDRLIHLNERIINVTETDEKMFIRFNDYFQSEMKFNILTIDKKNLNNRELITTNIYNYNSEFLIRLLRKSGFTKFETFGGLGKVEFLPLESKDIVIKAEK